MNAVQEFISITPWTIIFQICNLLILVLLIKKFLFKRVMAVLDQLCLWGEQHRDT